MDIITVVGLVSSLFTIETTGLSWIRTAREKIKNKGFNLNDWDSDDSVVQACLDKFKNDMAYTNKNYIFSDTDVVEITNHFFSENSNLQIGQDEKKQITKLLSDLFNAYNVYIESLMSTGEIVIHNTISSNCQRIIDKLEKIENKNSNDKSIEKDLFQNIINQIPSIPTNTNPLHYTSNNMSILVGRSAEIIRLQEFLADSSRAIFWVVSGPAGVGKSKLVYFFTNQKEYQQAWKFVYIDKELVHLFSNLSSWNYDSKNLCLIIDYANEYPEALGQWMYRLLSSKHYSKTNRLRILLIAREGKRSPVGFEDMYPLWFRKLSTMHYDITPYMFGNGNFLELSGLPSSELDKLINMYCMAKNKEIDQKNSTQTVPTLHYSINESDKKLIKMFIEKNIIDSDLGARPLYALFAVDAYLNNGNKIYLWNMEDLRKYIYEKDTQRWKEEINDKNILTNLKEMLVYATIVGQWDPASDVPVPSCLQTIEAELCHAINEYDFDPSGDWFCTLTGYCSLGKMKQNYILERLSPDMVGEYYVLQYFTKYKKNKYAKPMYNSWIEFFANNLPICSDFFVRSLQNYGEIPYYSSILLEIIERIIKYTVDFIDESELPSSFSIITNIIDVFIRGFKGSEDIMLLGRVKGVILRYSKKLGEKHLCWAELEAKYLFGDSSSQFYSYIKNAFKRIEILYNAWPDSETISNIYVTYLGDLIDFSLGSDNVYHGKLKATTQKYLNLFDSITQKKDILKIEALALAVLNSCFKVIAVSYQHNETIDIADKYTRFVSKILSSKKDNDKYVCCYIDNAPHVIQQVVKYGDNKTISKTVKEFKKYMRQASLHQDAFNSCWIGAMSMSEIIDCLCQYQHVSAAKDMTIFFMNTINFMQKTFPKAGILFLRKESAINRLFKSQFVDESVKSLLVDF